MTTYHITQMHSCLKNLRPTSINILFLQLEKIMTQIFSPEKARDVERKMDEIYKKMTRGNKKRINSLTKCKVLGSVEQT